MRPSITLIPKKRGPKPKGAIGVMVRTPSDQLARLDAWIATLPDPKPSRPEAMRRALEAVIRLGGLDPPPTPKAAPRKKAAAAKP